MYEGPSREPEDRMVKVRDMGFGLANGYMLCGFAPDKDGVIHEFLLNLDYCFQLLLTSELKATTADPIYSNFLSKEFRRWGYRLELVKSLGQDHRQTIWNSVATITNIHENCHIELNRYIHRRDGRLIFVHE